MNGPTYWRSLEELADTPEFQEKLHREFPQGASEWHDEASRRRFLKLMAASLSLAGITACTKQPTETIMPYVRPPEDVIPGKALFFATAVVTHGLAQGVLVESHEGRPTKVEGNPEHPASLGATDVPSQAAVLSLYDPDRAQAIRGPQGYTTWNVFQTYLRTARHGNVRVLTTTVTSPTFAAQMRDFLARYPGSKWVQYDATGPHAARMGAQLAFGQPVNTYYRLDAANVVVSLDADFLACGPASTRYAHDFANKRRVAGGKTSMNRLYVIESTMSPTGGKADHRWPVRPRMVEAFAEELAAALGVNGAAAQHGSGVPPQHTAAIARDLQSNRGAAVVIPGAEQPARVHALAHAMNDALGGNGRTAIHTAPVEANPQDQIGALRELTGELNAGTVDLLLIVGGNPVYNAPDDLAFGAAIRKAKARVFLSEHDNETAVACEWLVPRTHTLEMWSDARAFDGTVTILQPLIQPLYEAHSEHEVFAVLMDQPATSYEVVRRYWSAQNSGGDFEAWWRKSVHDGVVANSPLPPITPAVRGLTPADANSTRVSGIDVAFRPDPYLVEDGYANNGWIQELPRPMTKLTWDNAVLMSQRTADRTGVRLHDVVEINAGGRKVTGPVWIHAGQPDDCVTVHLGYGRSRTGRVGNNIGFNAYKLRTSDALWDITGAELKKTGRRHPLASTQLHHDMHGRELVIESALGEYLHDPEFAQKEARQPDRRLTLYPEWDYTGYAWGMAIDQTACVNCNACVIACQAENNIAVVGKEQVLAQRQMHWLRVDVYHKGPAQNPSAHYQPVPCMHCENAPCELVCPVQATNHSRDGLNDMIYNRCVGTRYCSNNCPYKVRRFNFFLFQDWNTPQFKLQRNPDVTVRSRGVMEKCTYCVQRIREVEITAREQDRPIRDGEIMTACQQACPTKAIVFGDINNRANLVAKLKADRLNYSLLAELNTRPRTTYLAEIRNPNPEIQA